ncbi:hypothetical protein [Ornithinimicrobium humiphilum]|uniref:hypothetical protein n=1 Tax=Ornithinimicrobium humiphilum TaxID=125288 RepID=UPI0011519941|nr:hypothetical protein [Ornithinimicrobium humiphilum]
MGDQSVETVERVGLHPGDRLVGTQGLEHRDGRGVELALDDRPFEVCRGAELVRHPEHPAERARQDADPGHALDPDVGEHPIGDPTLQGLGLVASHS